MAKYVLELSGLTRTDVFRVSQSLLQKSLADRRELLKQHFQPVPLEFDFAKASDGETMDEIQGFLEESVKDGCEGLMVKMLESDASYYEPSRRSVNWLKVSVSFCRKIGYILTDVIPMLLDQEGLSSRRRRFPGFGCRRSVLRKGQAHKRLWRVPFGMLRCRRGGISDDL